MVTSRQEICLIEGAGELHTEDIISYSSSIVLLAIKNLKTNYYYYYYYYILQLELG